MKEAELFEAHEVKDTDVMVYDKPQDLISKALDGSASVEIIERLITLRNQEYERNAKILYEENFRLLKNDLPIIDKPKMARNEKTGKDMYSYAPLDYLQKLCDPLILKHKFCYSWREEGLPDGWKRIWFVLSGYGHTKENMFDVPPVKATEWTNMAQVGGIQSKYGMRNSFVSGLGLNIIGEDFDANFTLEEYGKYRDLLNPIFDATNLKELAEAAQSVKKIISDTDTTGRSMLNQAYTKRKRELS